MFTCDMRLLSSVFWYACILLGVLAVTGCDEATLGPQTRGTIEGVVQDAETNAPIPQANVTTSPPTQSISTDENGSFAFDDIPTGNYSVTASKTNFESNAVEVKVRANETTTATIPLQRGEDFGATNDSLTARVTNWFNDPINRDSTGADSIFVDVEFSVRNVGDVRVQAYEVYFKIDTAEGPFFQEINGDSLDASQRDIGGFRTFVPAEAQEVLVDDVYWKR